MNILGNLASKKLSTVTASSLLAVGNEVVGAGMDWRVTIGVLGLAAIYAVVQGFVDVALVKAGKKDA